MLDGFAKAGQNFPKSFQVFLTYPFVDAAVGRDPQVARNLHMGDYTNLSVKLDVNLADLNLPGHPADHHPGAAVRRGEDRPAVRPTRSDLLASRASPTRSSKAHRHGRAGQDRGRRLQRSPSTRCASTSPPPCCRSARPSPRPCARRRARPSAACSANPGALPTDRGRCRSLAAGGGGVGGLLPRSQLEQRLPDADAASTRSTSPRWASTPASGPCSSRGWLTSDDHLTHQEAADRLRPSSPCSGCPSSAPATPGSTGCSTTRRTPSTRTSPSPAASSPAPRSPTAVSTIGQVSKMKLTDKGVDVLLSINKSEDKIPKDTHRPGRQQVGRR